MQSYRVEPGQQLRGEVRIPGDKSISHRAVMFGSIANGTTRISNFLDSEDCRATLAAFTQMGVTAERDDDGSLAIHGLTELTPPAAALDLGNSGTAMRLMMGFLAGQGVAATLTGDDSLRSRPMERIAAPLRAMGADVATTNGCAPVTLAGNSGLKGLRYELPVASAQIKSAVLLAGLGADGRTEVIAPGPSRDHTERMLKAMGVTLEITEDGLEIALDGPQALTACDIDVPSDLSSAAFFIVGACLNASEPVLLRNVGVNPSRDGVLTILRAMGARIEIENERQFGAEPVADLRIHRSRLKGIDISPEVVPLAIDELPVIFVAAAAAEGRTSVTGAEELRVKETDRLAVMARALAAVGVQVTETPDGLTIEGGPIRGGRIHSQGDHRIAMAFAMAALVSESAIEIQDTAPVATSFPGFVETAAQAGLAISVSGG